MAHLSENINQLSIIDKSGILSKAIPTSAEVEFIILPFYKTIEEITDKELLYSDLSNFFERCKNNSTIAILCSPIMAADFSAKISNNILLKLWIAVGLNESVIKTNTYIEQRHAALLVFTKYKESLKHTKTRIAYSYCPSCDKTTKDYGGKKHLYHEYGTIISDVWKDISVDFNKRPVEIIERLKDLFGIPDYHSLNIYDQRKYYIPNLLAKQIFKEYSTQENKPKNAPLLINGDCLAELKNIPDNSIDFCFADPPYNLKKKYETWNDGIDIQEYFNWCDKWLTELARILKPGRTVAILNIPQWCIRHFEHLVKVLDYQDWIVWEGLSMPVRMIMPSHYSILCFSKGTPRVLPGLKRIKHSQLESASLSAIKSNYCSRPSCIKQRKLRKAKDREFVSNIWWDIHRLKHNSRRVDHPCQLPPAFMYRLISLFTNENETIIDPFNGVGTSSLTAQQLNRKYIGIELSEYYHNITIHRQRELTEGIDPFRKINDGSKKAKNSPVERLKKQKYEVSKKVLQLEIKNISTKLGHIPTKEEVSQFSEFPMEYFENYFISWGEATAAARTTGMTENRTNGTNAYKIQEAQLRLFKEQKKKYSSTSP